MPTTPPRLDFRLLRTALLANAVFSISSGVALVSLATPVARLVGDSVPSTLISCIGVALIPFGAFAAWVATRRHPTTLFALGISVGDLSWVAASIVVVAAAYGKITPAGLVLVVAVALAVLGFALGQLRGIARIYRMPGTSPSRIRVCIEVCTAGDATHVWSHVANMGGISRFAPTLASSAMRDDATPGVGAVRECSDHGGRSWAERCVRFDPTRRELEVQFLADQPGFPFPFSALNGGWHVQPATEGVSVKIWWEGLVLRPVLAVVIAPLLAWQADRQFAGVVQRMAGNAARSGAATLPRLSVLPC